MTKRRKTRKNAKPTPLDAEQTGVLSLVALTVLGLFCWITYNVLTASNVISHCYVDLRRDTYYVYGNLEWNEDRELAEAATGELAAKLKDTLKECQK